MSPGPVPKLTLFPNAVTLIEIGKGLVENIFSCYLYKSIVDIFLKVCKKETFERGRFAKASKT